MQSQIWKKLLFAIVLTSSSANHFIRLDAAWAANLDRCCCPKESVSTIKSLTSLEASPKLSDQDEQKAINFELQQLNFLELAKTIQPATHPILPKRLIVQSEPASPATPDSQSNSEFTENSGNVQQNESPQLETQPSDFPQSSPKPIEQLLDTTQPNYPERLERLRQRLQEKKQPNTESSNLRELGLRVRQKPLLPEPLEQLPPPSLEQPIVKFKPIGFLKARVGYFHTSNIFSSDIIPIEDGLTFYGLSLASAYLPIGEKTYLNGSIDGNLIRYTDQSKYNYNQVRFNFGVYQQLSPRMYGEISWSNQQLFYANSSDRFQAGDRFLGENSLRLSLGRRDPLTQKLMLDSFYEFSLNFAEPSNRDRLVNSLWVSLNYYLQKPLQVGLDYQFNLSDFTQRQRNDNYHRIFGHLNYKISKSSTINLQSGVTFGNSTDSNIDFDGWFFSINYNLELGQF